MSDEHDQEDQPCLTYGEAWEIQRTVGSLLNHHSKCSSVPGHHPLSGPALLCDCGVIERFWNHRRFAKIERELAEARSMTEGQWLLKVAARLVTAGCKSDGIVDAMDELIQQRDTLAEAMIPAMARAYARGYNHGHEDTVESTFMTIHASDELTFFADDIRQMLLDGSHPEAQAALAAVKGGSHE